MLFWFHSFVDHFSASSVCQSPIPQADLQAALRQSDEITAEGNEQSTQTNTEVGLMLILTECLRKLSTQICLEFPYVIYAGCTQL